MQRTIEVHIIENKNTFLEHKQTRMIEQKVAKLIAFSVDARLLAEARRLEERERLQSAQRRLALGHCHRGAGH